MSQADEKLDHASSPGAPFALRVIRISGPDAEAFVQAQLTADTGRIASAALHPSAWCAADGRARAVLLAGRLDDGMLLVLPDALVDGAMAKLKMFSIGRRVRLEPGGIALPARAADDSGAFALAADPGRSLRIDDRASGSAPLPAAWLARDIDAKMPWLLPSTAGAFLPQMLGLDALDGLSYRKGCYPGQEVIARVHYRGRVTRRTSRFEIAGDRVPEPGSPLSVGDAAGTVLYAIAMPDGQGVRGLAVVPVDAAPNASVEAGSASGGLLAE